MARWWYICIALLLALAANAQAPLVLTQKTNGQLIGLHLQLLKDPQGQLSIQQILTPEIQKQFEPSTQEAPNFGNVETTVWNKLTVINQTDEQWLLSLENPILDYITFYYQTANGSIDSLKTGLSVNSKERNYRSPYYFYEIPAKRGDTTTFYFRIHTYLFHYPISVYTTGSAVELINGNNLQKGAYLGFILLIIIYNISMLVMLKDRTYFYYSLYIFFTGLGISVNDGIAAFLWGNLNSFLWDKGPTVIALSIITFHIFSSHFLGLNTKAPRTYWFIWKILVPAAVIIILLNWLDLGLYASIGNQSIGFISLVTIFIAAYNIYRSGYRPAGLYALGSSFYFVGVIIFILKTSAILPHTTFTHNAMELGSAIEIIFYSFSLADRINIFRKEKNAAQKAMMDTLQENERLVREQNIILEQKVKERTFELEQEKEKSEHLLLNILPYETAQELKEKGSADPQLADEVTVLFTDFKDFTKVVENMSHYELVNIIDHCFKAFDEIVDRHGVEKIKTIGDSYMAVGGLPVPDEHHAKHVLLAAKEMIAFVDNMNAQRRQQNLPTLEIRIGVHSGPVVAGIVGSKKFAYDIWGDTVNIAARMESSGEPGRINTSETTYQLTQHLFAFQFRGKVKAKNKGELNMYFVDGADASIGLS